jgi:hypothetical protein
MPYVSRDTGGNINGLFAAPQDFAKEFLPDDDPEVVAYLEPPPPQPSQEDQVLYDHENRIRSLEGQPPLTIADFLTKTGRTV